MVGTPKDALFTVAKILCLLLLDCSAEGACAKASELKALLAEGDTDDGDAPDKAGKEEAEHKSEAAEDEPDDISDGVTGYLNNGLAEGPERKLSHLECLLAKGDTDDSDAPDKAHKEPHKRGTKTGKEEPKYVADCLHDERVLSNFKICDNLQVNQLTL